MRQGKNTYKPDYAVRPGLVLDEHLEARDMSHAEFARRCDRSPKLISEIISGKAPVNSTTAIQFERVLGMSADIWLGMEQAYQLHKARQKQKAALEEASGWAQAFPVKELAKRGVFGKPTSDADAIEKLLSFFGVGSIDAWRSRYTTENIAYRHSPSFESSREAIATWLRLGELEAQTQECAPYDEKRFKANLQVARELTVEPVETWLPELTRLCNDSGVAFIIVKPLKGTALSGVARWLKPSQALIQLSARHMSDDHLWFSFFHEAAHLLLHSRKCIFVEGKGGADDKHEKEANRFASNFLVQDRDFESFIKEGVFTRNKVKSFAADLGIAPGIIVGMLQHRGAIPWGSQLNDLKQRFKWAD